MDADDELRDVPRKDMTVVVTRACAGTNRNEFLLGRQHDAEQDVKTASMVSQETCPVSVSETVEMTAGKEKPQMQESSKSQSQTGNSE